MKSNSNLNFESKASSSKLERLADKEEKTKQKKLEKQLTETEQKISELEDRLSCIESEMVQEFSNHVKLIELNSEEKTLKSELEQLYKLWETLASE